MLKRCFFFFLIVSCFSLSSEEVNFSKEVRPIIAKYCFACHGPDDQHREGGLRLDTEEGAKAFVKGVAAVVPGKPMDSEMYYRMVAEDEEELMPPPKHGKFMKPEEIAKVKKWIEQGAPWGKHWAYEPIEKNSPIEEGVHLIDHWVEKMAQSQGLVLNQEADKRTLIRRVSLDLRGLPPSLEEIQAYLKDSSHSAYENMVDRFLNSPQYGEKWALHWLDLARYADSQGYEKDRNRTIWSYRDWVIQAFNQDMPFDQFTIEQLAGDLLENPAESQVLATAFHRNTMTNSEGGTDDEEFRILAVKDRVDTTGLVWMGLTVGCAKCHTHKYDPITIDEYYELYAIFNQTADRDAGNDYPLRNFPENKGVAEKYQSLVKERQGVYAEIRKVQKALYKDDSFTAWVKNELKSLLYNSEKISKLDRKWKPFFQKLAKDGHELSEKEIEKAKDYFSYQKEEVAVWGKKVKSLNKEMQALGIPQVPIMEELKGDKRRVSKLHERGNFLTPGKVVKANFPRSFHGFEDEGEKSRLDLAKWLMSEQNTLTARVHVNRIWSILFGRGIVESLGDFGAQGSFPSHPRLLDHLASEFMEQGWSHKKLLKTIVLSHTYRRDSKSTDEQLKIDPKNIFLARGARVRLDAEMIRDQALKVTGLLSLKMYGPPVMPPQPEGIWSSVYNKTKWETSQGEDRHRRGLYTYIKRTAPYPSMMIFDGTSRENCSVQRMPTNTPLQAFVTMNDPVYVEAAMALGQTIAKKNFVIEQEIEMVFEKATSRLPREKELAQLTELYEKTKAYFKEHPERLQSFIDSYELGGSDHVSHLDWASWSVVVSAILNLDECFVKG